MPTWARTEGIHLRLGEPGRCRSPRKELCFKRNAVHVTSLCLSPRRASAASVGPQCLIPDLRSCAGSCWETQADWEGTGWRYRRYLWWGTIGISDGIPSVSLMNAISVRKPLESRPLSQKTTVKEQ